MAIVYYDEDDVEIGDDLSAQAIFLVCFELVTLIGCFYLIFLAPLSLIGF